MLSVSFQPFPVITTSRLVLRQLLLSDATEFFQLRTNQQVLKYLDQFAPSSLTDITTKIQQAQQALDNNEGIIWAMVPKGETKLIGIINFWRFMKEHYRAEIGYSLLPHYWGKGIMSEALQAVTSYGFTTLNLHSVEANVNPSNAASIRLLVRNGFVKEAHFKENFYFNGRFLDSGIYSLLATNPRVTSPATGFKNT